MTRPTKEYKHGRCEEKAEAKNQKGQRSGAETDDEHITMQDEQKTPDKK
ncbi:MULTISPECIES: hypothetical protein [Enterobacterales]